MKRAFVTGISGQDGAYLAQHLLSLGYEVWGGRRRSASGSLWRLDELGITDQVKLVPFDLLELPRMLDVLRMIRPDEVYNLAAMSFVAESWLTPLTTCDVDAMGALRLLAAVRSECPEARFYQASSSEMFGGTRTYRCCPGDMEDTVEKLTEGHPMHPRSPYGCAKLFAYWAVRNYRESFGMHASNGILFNHESAMRSPEFVTRKITQGLARIHLVSSAPPIQLGNLNAKRDWGNARDYVEAMALMLQQDKPDDYVIATGETHTVREFVEAAFRAMAREVEWSGEGLDEVGKERRTGRLVVTISPELFRPAEVDVLLGDASKAQRVLGWKPRTTFAQLVELMVEADLERGLQCAR